VAFNFKSSRFKKIKQTKGVFMIKETPEMILDEVDKRLLRALQQDGRLSNVELARKVHLSPPATHARVRRLEKEGYIRQYAAVVSREKTGYDLLCFIHVSLQMHQLEQVENFRQAIRSVGMPSYYRRV